MRIPKKFGERSRALESKEVKKKFFLVFEGDKTEVEYFEGINNNKRSLGIDPIIEIRPILRGFLEEGWSNPKKLLDRLIEYIAETQEKDLTIRSVVEKAIEWLKEDSVLVEECIYTDKELFDLIIQKFEEDDIQIIKTNDDEKQFDNISKKVIEALKEIISIEGIVEDLKKYILNHKFLFDNEIDELCLVVDRDKHSFVSSPENDQYAYVVEKCTENDINLYISNPCFEFWLLLHFDEVHTIDKVKLIENEKIGSRRFAEIELRKLVSGYKKNNIKFEEFLGKIDKAIENEKLFSEDIQELKHNIGSNVGQLITKIRE